MQNVLMSNSIKKIFLLIIAIMVVFLCSEVGSAFADTSLPAFPGAEGFGATTQGGRGGTVYRVVNLNDSGSGSLRAAAEANGPRIVIFDVSGTIELTSRIAIDDPYITVAGQTAPGDGITLRGFGMDISTHDVVIRYIRIRHGPIPANDDSLNMLGASNVVIDHCSFSWASDENLSAILFSHDVTVQWSIISEELTPGGSGGSLFNAGVHDLTLHHNIYATNNDRNPKMQGETSYLMGEEAIFSFVNNLVHNWGAKGLSVAGSGKANIVGNYFSLGPNSTTFENPGRREVVVEQVEAGVSVWADENVGPTCPGGCVDDWSMVSNFDGNNIDESVKANAPFNTPTVTTSNANTAKTQVLEGSGANIPYQDPIDKRVITSVSNNAGTIFDDPNDFGGWPTLTSDAAPVDSDNDGMPDSWETAFGFNPNSSSDANLDADGDGYHNIEEYINSTVPTIGSSWIQAGWRRGGNQTLFSDALMFFNADSIDYLSQTNAITLAKAEQFTNTGFELNTNSWITNAQYDGLIPSDIPGVRLWLKADAILGLSDGESVSSWVDSSGTASSAEQTDPNNRPTYQINEINNKPVVRFDNTDDIIEGLYSADISNDNLTIFLVMEPRNTAATVLLPFSHARGPGDDSSYKSFAIETQVDTSPDRFYVAKGDGSTNTNLSIVSSGDDLSGDNALSIWTVTTNGDSIEVLRDGNSYGSGTGYTLSHATNDFRLGEAIGGDIAEIIVYDQTLSAGNITAINQYLASKYNVGTSTISGSSGAVRTSTTYHNFSYGSSRLTAVDSTDYVQTHNLPSGQYTLEMHIYNGGNAVTAVDAALIADGSPLATTITAGDNNWYLLNSTFSATTGSKNYGVRLTPGLTVYVDDVSLYNYQSTGTLTSSIFDTGQSSAWGTLTYSATTPLDSAVSVKVRTGNNESLSDAAAFTSCNTIASNTDISSNNCVTDGHRYAQYQVVLTPSSNPHTPTFESFQLTFAGMSSQTSTSISSPAAPGCSDQSPGRKTPAIYAVIPESPTSVKLYFTQADKPFDRYFVRFGTKSGDYPYGGEFLVSDTTRTLVIDHLSPSTQYFFQMRAGNGCATGGWSNEISAKTKGLVSFRQLDFAESTLESVTDVSETDSSKPGDSCQTYTVKIKDNLWGIAASELGDGNRYSEIIEQNKDQFPSLEKNNSVSAGWKLKINCAAKTQDERTSETTQPVGYAVNIKVTNKDKQPVEGAKVTIHSKVQETTTDASGIARFENVEPGDHRVLIAYKNFEGEQSLNLTGDVKEFNLNIVVEQKNVLTSPIVMGVVGGMGLVILILVFLLLRARSRKA